MFYFGASFSIKMFDLKVCDTWLCGYVCLKGVAEYIEHDAVIW